MAYGLIDEVLHEPEGKDKVEGKDKDGKDKPEEKK